MKCALQRVWIISVASVGEVINDRTCFDAMIVLTSHGIFILIDEVFGHIFGHKLVCRLRHPCMDEGRKIEKGRAIKRQLVMEELVSGFCVGSLLTRQRRKK